MTRSYLAVAAAVVVLLSVQTFNRQWSNDWYLHAATIRELSVRPLHPHHPESGTRDVEADSSPYQLVLGLVMRETGLDVVRITQLAAIVDLLALLAVFPLFVRCFSARPRAPTWALLFLLTLWGVNPLRWSGYFDLNSIGFGLAYPATAAFVLALGGLVVLDRWTRRPRLAVALAAAALLAVAALTHPPSALPCAIAATSLVVWRLDDGVRRHWWHLATGAVLGVVILLAWPLYDFFALLSNSGRYDIAGDVYRSAPTRSLLLLLAVPALWRRWQRDHRDALALTAAGTFAVYVGAWLAGAPTLGRTMPFLALSLQVALADDVAGRLERRTRPERVRIAAIAVVAVGVLCCATVFPRFVPRPLLPSSMRDRSELQPVDAGYGFLHMIPGDDVVLAESPDVALVVPVFGGKTLVPREAQFVDDLDQRLQAQDAILSNPDMRLRKALARRYNVKWLLLDAPTALGPGRRPLQAWGPVVHRDSRYVLIRVGALP